jgi:FtsH-binding integral membrane protein
LIFLSLSSAFILALALYLDAFNIFLALLRILNSRN